MKAWVDPVRWRGMAMLSSAFSGGKFKAGEEVGQDQHWILNFLPAPRQHPSVPLWGHHLWVYLQNLLL